MMNGDPLDELDEQAEEIARLRSQPCPYVVGRTTLHCSLTPFTLTDAEREAINDAVYLCGATAGLANEQANATAWATCAATLRGLLERTK
jgi:hypothetical protein